VKVLAVMADVAEKPQFADRSDQLGVYDGGATSAKV